MGSYPGPIHLSLCLGLLFYQTDGTHLRVKTVSNISAKNDTQNTSGLCQLTQNNEPQPSNLAVQYVELEPEKLSEGNKGQFGMKKYARRKLTPTKDFFSAAKTKNESLPSVTLTENKRDPPKYRATYRSRPEAENQTNVQTAEDDAFSGSAKLEDMDFTSRIFGRGRNLVPKEDKISNSEKSVPSHVLEADSFAVTEQSPEKTKDYVTTERTRKRYGWKIRRRNRTKSAEHPSKVISSQGSEGLEVPSLTPTLEPVAEPTAENTVLSNYHAVSAVEEAPSSSDHEDAETQNQDQKEDPKAPKETEEGSGGESDSEKHSAHGEKSSKKYSKHHKDDKVKKGHHDKESHQGEYGDDKGTKFQHEDEAGNYEEEDESEEGGKKSEHGEHEDYKKGHSTRGGHVIHKKDEYEKKTEFFDEDDDDGHGEKYGEFYEHHEAKKGGHEKGEKEDGAHDFNENKKKGHFSKGHEHSEDTGKDEKIGHQTFHEHHEKYGKKSGNEDHHNFEHTQAKKPMSGHLVNSHGGILLRGGGNVGIGNHDGSWNNEGEDAAEEYQDGSEDEEEGSNEEVEDGDNGELRGGNEGDDDGNNIAENYEALTADKERTPRVEQTEVQDMLKRHPSAEYLNHDGPTSYVRFRDSAGRQEPGRLTLHRREHARLPEGFQAPTNEAQVFRNPYHSSQFRGLSGFKPNSRLSSNAYDLSAPYVHLSGSPRPRRYHLVEPQEDNVSYHVTTVYQPVSITAN